MKTYPAIAIANEFLDLADKDKMGIDPMKLQKLVYICHGYRLAAFEDPLFEEDVEVWRWGPVIPSIYHEFKGFGNKKITRMGEIINDSLDIEVPKIDPDDKICKELFEIIWENYKYYTGVILSNSTHQKGTPWDISNRKGHTIIDNKIIGGYYRRLLELDD